MTLRFAIARNFQCKGTWTDRLLVAEGEGWRPPGNEELKGLTADEPPGDETACSLFSVPVHMRSRFWSMLNEEVAEGTGDFSSFSDDLARFLTFKELPPPEQSVCELLLQEGGKVETADIWALVNFGDESVVLAWPSLRLHLAAGEGCRIAGLGPEVMPSQTDDMNVLLAIRLAAA